MIGSGARIPNRGQMLVKLEAGQGDTANQIASIFQVVKATRPLMSVGKICDGGLDVLFKKDFALVLDSDGHEVCRFTLNNVGVHTAQCRLKRPTPKPVCLLADRSRVDDTGPTHKSADEFRGAGMWRRSKGGWWWDFEEVFLHGVHM